MSHRVSSLAALLASVIVVFAAPAAWAQAASPGADLSVQLSAPQDAEVGEVVKVTADLTNSGPEDTMVAVSFEIGDLQVEGLPEICQVEGTTIECQPQPLGAGHSAGLQVQLSATEAGQPAVAATVSGDGEDAADPNEGNDSDSVVITFYEIVLGVAEHATPAEIAIEISQEFHESAPAVVLSRDDDFADSLTGSVLSATSPLLFTDNETLDLETREEIDRLLEPGDEVLLLGGEMALGPAVQNELEFAGYAVRRLAGPTRVETALAIAEEAERRAGPTGLTQVALARATAPADNPTAAWTDSVTAGAWAARTGQPILLTPTLELDPAVAEWLAARPALERILLGGESALSPAVAEAVGPHVRHAGDNRYATAAQIAAARWTEPSGFVVTSGDHALGWAYGLATAGLSARLNMPLLLVETDRLPAETNAVTCPAGVRMTTRVAGGTDVVSEPVREALAGPC